MGPYAVKTGQLVYVNDSNLVLHSPDPPPLVDAQGRPIKLPEVDLHVFISYTDPQFQVQPGITYEATVSAHTALFGGDPLGHRNGRTIRFGHGEGVPLAMDGKNVWGCEPYKKQFDGAALLVNRGGCTFLEKLVHAKNAGASGVVVINDKTYAVNPSADEEAAKAAEVDDVAIVVVASGDGEAILAVLNASVVQRLGQAMLAVAPKDESIEPKRETKPKEPEPTRDRSDRKAASNPPRNLYLNGHPLVNTRLMV